MDFHENYGFLIHFFQISLELSPGTDFLHAPSPGSNKSSKGLGFKQKMDQKLNFSFHDCLYNVWRRFFEQR